VRLPRISARVYRWICAATVAAVVIIVVTGAAVRLTGSGLGCTDWPKCTNNQVVSVTGYHRSIEQLNRMFTGVVSVAIILAVAGSLGRQPRRRDLLWWSLGLVAGLVGQIVLGGIVVKVGLSPPFVMGHFILSAILVWNAVVLFDHAGRPDLVDPSDPTRAVDPGHTIGSSVVTPPVRLLSRVMMGVAAAVLLTGTVVTGTGPHGGDEHVRRLPFFVEDVARIHSVTAWVFLGLALTTLWRLYRDGASPSLRRRSTVLAAAVGTQGAIGYTQYFLGVPPGLVVVHVAGATAVWMAAVWFHLGLTAYPELIPTVEAELDTQVTGMPV
jgi:cytochrome c oxidase assembly protein subunit 15